LVNSLLFLLPHRKALAFLGLLTFEERQALPTFLDTQQRVFEEFGANQNFASSMQLFLFATRQSFRLSGGLSQAWSI